MSAKPVTILGVPGSLREHSFNTALIHAARDVAPEGVEVKPYLLHDIPLYNADVEALGLPAPVARFKQAIAEADGVLFSTPQYNRSVSGVLKNAIDWASRPAFESPLAGKPIAVIGATSGRSATEMARKDLLRILESCRSEILDTPSLGLSESGDHIEEGQLQSEEVRQRIRSVVEQFTVFIRGNALARAAG